MLPKNRLNTLIHLYLYSWSVDGSDLVIACRVFCCMIACSMPGCHVKQACRWGAGGARVIQVGGGSRDLYYYPKDAVLVTAISPSLRKGVYLLLNGSMTSLVALLSSQPCCCLSPGSGLLVLLYSSCCIFLHNHIWAMG